MNKTALKNFATSARRELLKKVEAKALKIGITVDKITKAEIESSDAIFIDGRQLSKSEKVQRERLIDRINQTSFSRVMEEVAYTWFNRFTALRFMEVNNYLPTKVRVLSSSNGDSAETDAMKEAMSLDLDIDKELVYEMKVNNESEELFKYLIIKHCNDLNRFMPFMFEKIDDFTEILFPEGLLAKDSFIRQMTNTEVIPEDNWEKVEVIGWLYQYYIAEEKDRVIKAKKKYKTEEIPFATQLFTPDWIVRYMVQNSLGRYWIESHPEHRDLLSKWEFYLENPNPEPDFEEKLAPYINKELKVEDIKCFDPAMGSGHILVYMFDLLYEIYSKCGYMDREIPRLIIEKNLYGLDIDDRAYQLACFSVVMKALEYNKRFFRSIEREGLLLNLASIQETNNLDDEDIAFISGEREGELFNTTKEFIEQFKDAKAIGSLVKVKSFAKELLETKLEQIENTPAQNLFEEVVRNKVLTILPNIFKQSEILEKEYDILISNPPYIGNKYMSDTLNKYLGEFYNDVKMDLFSAFIKNSFTRVKHNGQIGFMTPFVWMFISSYEQLRKIIIDKKNISSLIQLEYSAFEEATVPICTFTLRNYHTNISGEFIKLDDFKGAKLQPIKTLEAINNSQVSYRFTNTVNNLAKVPGYPIAFWANDEIFSVFEYGKPLGEVAEVKRGMTTSNNNRFLRFWAEVSQNKIYYNALSHEEAMHSRAKWFPYSKGGGYRKWYGFFEYLVNWENSGQEVIEFAKTINKSYTRTIVNMSYYFKPSIGFSYITSGPFSMRWIPEGFLYDSGGPGVFADEDKRLFIIGCLNSKPAQILLKMLNPTINLQIADVVRLPLPTYEDVLNNDDYKNTIKQLIALSKDDWDSYETSWDFKVHPLLNKGDNAKLVSKAFNKWAIESNDNFMRLKELEEKVNRTFIDLYNLQEVVSPEVLDDDITIRKANRVKDIISFISYSIGCMFGRYSLDEEGLIYAGGEFDPTKYQTFPADQDNILPILPGVYFEDDIVSRFIDFVKVTFGEETLSENLDFIADTLGKKKGETAKETIRRYFLNDFYKDHVQTYKKRPIYWLFTSGKQKAFNCLIYMHRYDKTTLSRIRTDYLHEYQIRLDAEKRDLLTIIEGDSTAKEISNAKRELKTLEKKIEELKEYDEVLHHMADMQIEMDLDDGVVVNYEKFKGLVAPIK